MELRLGVIILGAGASRRMGRPKLLLPWNGTSILGTLLNQWQMPGAEQIAVVTAANDQPINTELDRLGFVTEQRIVNPNPNMGMFASVQCAARWNGWNPRLTHWAIVLRDQPHLKLQTLWTLIEFAARHPGKVCQPVYGGHRRHPVILPENIFRQLKEATSEVLKQFLETHRPSSAYCEIDDAALALDIDRPADYEQALKEFGGAGALTEKIPP